MNPDLPPEPGTDPKVRIVRAEVQAAQEHVETAMKRGLMWSDVKSVVIALSAVASVLLAGAGRIDAYAQDKVDAGVQRELTPLAKDIDKLKLEVEILKIKTINTEGTVGRLEQKQDRMLEALRIPNPAPAPKDGGQ